MRWLTLYQQKQENKDPFIGASLPQLQMINHAPLMLLCWDQGLNLLNQSVQSTGLFLNFFNSPLAFEKHLQLMNFPKDSGDGWAVFMTAFFFWSISFSFLWAKPPHKIKTTPCCVSLTRRMMASVRLCQPYLEWEFGWWALKIQPCSASGFLINNNTM